MRLAIALAMGALLALSAAASPPARADVFGPIELTSTSAAAGSVHEQAGEATFPVISADGRYVAFVGSFGGVRGIWRRDLETGVVAQVAPGDATMPSISADGRYVSFTTDESLVPEDTNSSPDVYVRDMEPAEGEPEYALASAVNGSDEGATYTFAGKGEGVEGEFGSLAGARAALSADGRYVVFVTTAPSNLLGTGVQTPAQEVLLRDLATKETTLVSAEYNAVAGRPANGEDIPIEPHGEGFAEVGAAFTDDVTFHELLSREAVWVGASISADGSTVAWMGQELGEQTQLLPGEQSTEGAELAEPLWRRIADGATAPIRRITGGSDPANPLCAASGEQTLPESEPSPLDPCAGPFEHYVQDPEGLWGTKVSADYVPQMSADGDTVAFVTGAREIAAGESQFQKAETYDDLYIVNMASGLTRVAALRRLTAIGGGAATEEQIEKSYAVLDYSVSPDGTQVAFTTQRTQYPLASPTFVSATAAAPGMIELFDADLANNTLTRVTHGFGGEDERSEQLPTEESPGVDPYHNGQGAYSPSFSEDGNTLSFASSANNLVYGDGNDASDAFVVHRIPPTPGVVPQYVSPPPANPALTPPWALAVTAVSLADGRVRLYAEVPGAGKAAAGAIAAVRVRVGFRSARTADGARRRKAVFAVATRTVASARATASAPEEGLVPLTLTLTPAYSSLAAGAGVSASVRVTFSAPGHRALRASVAVLFRRTVKAKRASRSHAAARRAGKRSSR